MLYQHLKTGLSGVAAFGLCAASAMAQESDFVAFASQQVNGGARGLLLGEEHTSVGLPQLVSKNAKALKQQANFSTLYVEYYSGNQQHQLDRALRGEAKAQRELHADFTARAKTTEGAQARYNLMYAAHRAGMRVLAFDTSVASFPIYLTPQGELTQMRMTLGDAYMSQTIRKHDDGRPFIAIMGQLHNAMTPEASRLGAPSLLGTHSAMDVPSPQAGVPQRLSRMGISTSVLDLSDVASVNDKPSIWPVQKMQRNLNGAAQVHGVHELMLPPDPARQTPTNRYARAHGSFRFMQELLEPVLARPSPGVNGTVVQQRATALNDAFMACASAPQVRQLAAAYSQSLAPYKKARLAYGHKATQTIVRETENKMNAQLRGAKFVADQKAFCSPAGTALWRRAP